MDGRKTKGIWEAFPLAAAPLVMLVLGAAPPVMPAAGEGARDAHLFAWDVR